MVLNHLSRAGGMTEERVLFEGREKVCTFAVSSRQYPGKSYTVSSPRIPQGLIAARVVGCSDAM